MTIPIVYHRALYDWPGVQNCTMSDCQFVKSGICLAGPPVSEKSRGLPVLTGLFEVGYESDAKAKSWGELQEDIGVDNKTRLFMAMWAKQDPNIDMPSNLDDVIYTTNYGMSYSNPADISLDLLTVPQKVVLAEVESLYGARIVETAVNVATAGEPFEICFVAQNFGGDGHITALLTV